MQPLDKATASLLRPLYDDYYSPRTTSSENILRIGIEDVKGQKAAGSCSKKMVLTIFSEYVTEDGEDDSTDKKKSCYQGPPKDSHSAYRFFSRFPFKKHRAARNNEMKYEVGFTDISIELIEQVWIKSNFSNNGEVVNGKVVFYDDKSELLYKSRLLAERVSEDVARQNGKFKSTKELDFSTYVKYNFSLPPSPHQQMAAITGIRENAIFDMDPGTGKTYSAIMVGDTLCDKKTDFSKPFLTLVLCPKAVRENWRREYKKFSSTKTKATVIRGSKKNDRIAEVITGCVSYDIETCEKVKQCVIIMNYECFVSMHQAIRNIEWDLVIFDESHAAADIRTNRTKALLTLRRNSFRRLALSGTPFKNSITDLHPQLEFLFEGCSGVSNQKEYRDLYTSAVKTQTGITKITGYKNMPMFQERWARHSFSATLEEVLPDLPKERYDYVEVTMTPKQAEVYKQVATQLYAQLECELTGAENSLTVNHILTQLLRLAQITAGYVVWDEKIGEDGELLEDSKVDWFDENNRIERLVEILKAKKPWQKTQIWCAFVPVIKKLEARLKLEGIDCVTYYGATKDADRAIAERRFNEDVNCKVLIGNPKAGGVGLNLRGYNYENPDKSVVRDEFGVKHDTNCDHVIFYTYNWSSDARKQAIARAVRRGTRVSVQVTVFGVPNSIDTEINDRVENKIKTGMAITDVSGILTKILSSNPAVNGD